MVAYREAEGNRKVPLRIKFREKRQYGCNSETIRVRLHTKEQEEKGKQMGANQSTMTREERMATESVGRLMASMTLPAILAQIINILYSIIDRIYIGHMEGVGANALTGVGVTFCITVFISAFSGFINSGAAPLAAIWLGKQDRDHAEKILGNSVSFLVVCTVALMAVFYAFQRPLLYQFGASDATIEYAVDYLTIYLAGTLFVELSEEAKRQIAEWEENHNSVSIYMGKE